MERAACLSRNQTSARLTGVCTITHSPCIYLMYLCRSKSIEWTDTQLYIDVLGHVATRAGIAVACDSTDDGLMTLVSGVPKVFEAFVMMCVSYLRLYLNTTFIIPMDRATNCSSPSLMIFWQSTGSCRWLWMNSADNQSSQPSPRTSRHHTGACTKCVGGSWMGARPRCFKASLMQRPATGITQPILMR